MEECAEGMVQRSNNAAVKDAQVKFGKEECAEGMGQRGQKRRNAEINIAQTSLQETFFSLPPARDHCAI
jgi:hypothetical protein